MIEKHLILCGGTEVTGESGTHVHRLWLDKKRRQICLGVDSLTRKMVQAVPSILHDLLEIATYVYVGDQLVSRGGERSFDYGEKWHRCLHFKIPVCEYDFWADGAIGKLLEETLHAAAGETYRFEFVERAVRDRPNFLDVRDGAEYKYKIDEVVLFSGGLDSFTGAMDEVVSHGKTVCLVSHQSNGKMVRLQKDLHGHLAEMCKAGPKPLHVPVMINKDRRLTHEKSQRSRSFLFATLAAIVAHHEGLERARFYENGIVSCNLPWDGQTLQARATRSTHPRVLHLLSMLVSEVVGYDFRFENPYFEKTKTEVVERLAELYQQALIKETRSCAGSVYQNPYTHCGRCSQCIDRRFATIAAKCEECDPQRIYCTNIFTDALEDVVDRTMAAGFVGFAHQTGIGSQDGFTMKYVGQLLEMSRHMGVNGQEEGLKRLFELHRRHAGQVNAVIDCKLRENTERLRIGSLPESCLVRIVASGEHRNVAGLLRVVDKKGTKHGQRALEREVGNRLAGNPSVSSVELAEKIGNTSASAVRQTKAWINRNRGK